MILCKIGLHRWKKYVGGPIGIDTLRSCQRCDIVQKYMGGKHLDDGWMTLQNNTERELSK